MLKKTVTDSWGVFSYKNQEKVIKTLPHVPQIYVII